MARNDTSPVPLSPGATLQLTRRQSAQDRIRDILEVRFRLFSLIPIRGQGLSETGGP